MTVATEDPFPAWLAALKARHLSERTLREVGRSVRALSSLYVERRGRLGSGAALDGAGKRAAFALFYAPLHFLLVREAVRSFAAARPAPGHIMDLGCGTGAGGAAWALEGPGRCRIAGVDRSAWAVAEAHWNYRALGLRGRARRADLDGTPLPRRGGAVLAAFTVNELDPAVRAGLLARMLRAASRGACVLVVEPTSRRAARWWGEWSVAFRSAGGRDDEWRREVDLAEPLRLLDRLAGLDHRELTGRSLWLGSRPGPERALRT